MEITRKSDEMRKIKITPDFIRKISYFLSDVFIFIHITPLLLGC